jgi:ubiquinone/menaquinone biosynthesis C-methylase UbiE
MMSRLFRIAIALAVALASVSCAAVRAPAAEAERIAEVLELRRGVWVADVGAGKGEWSRKLASRVGDAGHVYATEIDEDDVAELEDRIDQAGLGNVTTVLGEVDDTGLPDACCDAILLRLVYHHFTEPPRMRQSLRRALRPGGLIAVIEIEPQGHWPELEGVPDRGGHGIAPDDLVSEMTIDGFEVVARYATWEGGQDRYCIVFRR